MTNSNDALPYVSGDPYADYRAADHDFTLLTDLADRRLGGSVIAANDEFFAQRENLIKPGAPVFDVHDYGHKGKVMDGWETRRRRGAGAATPLPDAGDHDWAVIRLGVPGVVRGLLVDTAHFRANYPQAVSVEAAAVNTGLPDETTKWEVLVPRSPVRGHAANGFAVDDDRRWTHLRLNQHPDGGVARLRVHGEPVPDPAWLALLGTFDLAAVVNGGSVEDASDRFYGEVGNLLRPDLARKMDDGWESRRRRDDGHDWARVRLAAEGEIRAVEIDTAYYVGNAAGWASLEAYDGSAWTEVLPRTRLAPDALHRFPLPAAVRATHVRLNTYPDGGVARLRVHGSLTPAGTAELRRRYEA